MAAILQMAFWNAFTSIKIVVFWFKFHWDLFLKAQMKTSQHYWFRYWLSAERATGHCLEQWWTWGHRRIYASLGISELKNLNLNLNPGFEHCREMSDGRVQGARRVSSLRLCSANHRPGYWGNLPCDWPSTVRSYSEQETENGPGWSMWGIFTKMIGMDQKWHLRVSREM